MGMGTVELSTSPGPTKNLVANIDCWMGDILIELLDEDRFRSQNRHSTVVIEGQLRGVIDKGKCLPLR